MAEAHKKKEMQWLEERNRLADQIQKLTAKAEKIDTLEPTPEITITTGVDKKKKYRTAWPLV
eukprot:TRINITY_DN3886_c0_g1_i1.p4 TRINITY_DN3886_c0_g1~~TRINITY_DN3886_c0_g1_i1.p4  ORF type:complete len:62 (+),score=19.88 TRINITY_DN3886_c0_g1_i1:264-449(+)